MFGLKDDLFLIVYAGNIGHKQGLDVLPALSKLMSPNSQLLVIGDGSQKDRLEEACRQVGASNITFTGLQSPESLASALASANVLFLSQSARVVDSVVPSKLLTYMAAGKPVLAAVDANSVAAEIVKKAGCGIVVMPGSARDIADGFADLAARPLEELGMLGENARQYVADHHNRGSILARWVSLIGELAELQRGGRSH
jgi:colanic acid biosynthesis glycosyl transferase WcaI